MKTRLDFKIRSQPDDSTCGPTCLHAVYKYFGDRIGLKAVIREVPRLENGGTLAALLGIHALNRGYQATLYTFNLDVFDPTWFKEGIDLKDRLLAQDKVKSKQRLKHATHAYLEFLDHGGKILFNDLTSDLVRRHLKQGHPILTGLSATFLYRCAREYGPTCEYDDVRGEPTGHFVVLHGYEPKRRVVHVADPYLPNPIVSGLHYKVPLPRLVCAILLGVLTYDANLLILSPKVKAKRR